MLTLFKALALGSVAALAQAQSSVTTGSTTSLGRIYAYGRNITALPVFYSDAVAYIGNVWPENATTTTNVTCTLHTYIVASSPRP